MTSFSDILLDLPKDAPRAHDTFPAKYMTEYLESYVENHVYQGKTLRDRIRLNTEVCSVEKQDGVWVLHIGRSSCQRIRSTKLAVAAGTTSLPIMPTFSYTPESGLPIIHHRDFGIQSEEILAPSSAYSNITVLGGGKSAADMVYTSLKAGKNVSWIIRKSGEGPGIFMNPSASGRYKHLAEAGVTQNATILNPSGFRPMVAWAQNLHQSDSERANLESKLLAADARFKAWANYDGREDALPGFHGLEPTAL